MRLRYPLVPSPGWLDFERSDQRAGLAVEVQLDRTAFGGTGHPGIKFYRALAAEIHAFDLNIGIVGVGRHKNSRPAAGPVFGAHARFPANGGRFRLNIRIECADLRNACFVPEGNLGNRAVNIIVQFRDADGTPFAVDGRLGKIQGVIETENIGVSLVINDARVVSGGSLVPVHDHSLILPGTGGIGAQAIPDAFRTAGGGIRQIVNSVAFIKPRTFLIVPWLRWLFDHIARKGNHVLVQFHIIDIRVAPIQIGLAVIVNEYGGINVLTAPGDQRFAEGVHKRTGRTIRDGHGNGHRAVPLLGNRTIQIELTIAVNALARPGAVFHRPTEDGRRSNGPAIRPIHHVG